MSRADAVDGFAGGRVRRWVVETPRASTEGERASTHLIEWIRAHGGSAQYRPIPAATSTAPALCFCGRVTHAMIGVGQRDGGQVWMSPGDYVTLNADGTFTVTPDDPRPQEQ